MAEHQQRRGDPAEHDRRQHQRERVQPLGQELALCLHVVGDVKAGLQGGHAA
jgi:hypothetical protein